MKPLNVALLLSLCSPAVTTPHLQSWETATVAIEDSVNIRERGAIGDGSTDDTSAVVKAFSDVCDAGGGTIYVPRGVFIVDPASSSIRICSNLIVEGPGTLKVKPDAGDYRYIFAPDPMIAPVNNVTFREITVDQNTYANTTATIRIGEDNTLQHVWQIFGGVNLHFEDMQLEVSGVNPIDVNGATISGVYIVRNHVVFQKRSGQPDFDNSSIYIHGTDFHVEDNTFTSTLMDAAVTAIEVHEGSGAVSGNTINGYAFGMNLVDLHGATVIGNSVRNAAYGISLWSLTDMESVLVRGNTISVDQVTRGASSAYGIATSYNIGINGNFSNLQIAGNVISFEKESTSRAIAGNANYGIGLQAFGNIANAVLLGNEIIRAPVRGVVVGVADAKYTTSGVSVRDNRIVDAGSRLSRVSADYSAGIALQGNLSSVDVVRNRLEFVADPFIGRYSYWSHEDGYVFRDVVVADNYTTAVNGSPENGLTASVLQSYPRQ